ncbi:MAG: hypothetical protein KAI47_12535 [Deltaproteobacteria bacterium]|nr:hypothetical protein [Deltaproteobacteria bacterium]
MSRPNGNRLSFVRFIRLATSPAAPRYLLGIALAFGLLATTATHAHAEVIYDADGRVVLRPAKYYVGFSPIAPTPVIVTPAPAPILVVAPAIAPTLVVTPSVAPAVVEIRTRRDAYDTHGLVIAGAGVGGLLLRGSDVTSFVPTYRLHLGLAVGQAEIGLRANLAPHAITLAEDTPTANDISLYATRLTFDYRFIPGAVVHPIAGAGFEAIVADPVAGDTGLTFAATARIGLEFAYPLGHSALAVGIDATGHIPLAQTDAMAVDLDAMLSFGAYLDFRF